MSFISICYLVMHFSPQASQVIWLGRQGTAHSSRYALRRSLLQCETTKSLNEHVTYFSCRVTDSSCHVIDPPQDELQFRRELYLIRLGVCRLRLVSKHRRLYILSRDYHSFLAIASLQVLEM